MHNPTESSACIRKANKCYTYYMYFHQSLFHVQVNSHVHTTYEKNKNFVQFQKENVAADLNGSYRNQLQSGGPALCSSPTHLNQQVMARGIITWAYEILQLPLRWWMKLLSTKAVQKFYSFDKPSFTFMFHFFQKWIRFGLVGGNLWVSWGQV